MDGMANLQVAAALAGAAASAAAALAAPRLRTALGLDTAQAWRWVVHPGSLDLYADPSGRLALLAGGGALHHARVALAADGLAAAIDLLPGGEGLLATVRPAHEVEITPEAKELYAATARIEVATSGGAVGAGAAGEAGAAGGVAPGAVALAALALAAETEGVRLRVLSGEEVRALVAATSISRPARERIGRDTTASFAVLHGEGDGPADWLRAGQALSAVWLTAIQAEISVVPSSAVVQLPGSREALRQLLAGTPAPTPYIALRLTTHAPFSPRS
jgi:hypothetical protein